MPIWTAPQLTLSPERLPWRDKWPAGLIPQVLAEAGPLLQPQAVYEIVPIQAVTAAGPVVQGEILRSALLAEALGPAGQILLAVYTIGPELDAAIRAWNERGEHTRAFLLDAMGTVALLELAEQLHRDIAAQVAGRGLQLGCPLSPGQDDWPLADQRALFDLLRPERIGIRLNEQHVMVPLKSASEAIPLGKEGELTLTGPACARCPRRGECPYRRETTGE